MQSFYRQDCFRTLDKASRELRDAVRDLVSGPMRASEGAVVERIEKKRQINQIHEDYLRKESE
jgi:spore germination protein GerM